MTVTTNYLVTGNGITGSTAEAVQALVSGDGTLPGAAFGWWVHPTIAVDGDITYVGYAADTSHGIGVAAIHRTSGAVQRKLIDVLDHNFEAESPVPNPCDDHDVPSVTVMRDQSVLAVYSAHAIESKIYIKRLSGRGSLDVAWSSELTTSDRCSYAQVLRLTSGPHAGKLLLFYRVGDSGSGVWALRTSLDDGRNWTAEQTLITAPYCNFALQPANGGRVVCYSYINPATADDHDPYYFILDATGADGFIQGNALTTIANTGWLAGSATALPVARTAGHRVVDIAAHPASIRISDARRYDNNASSNGSSLTGRGAGTAMLLGTEFTRDSEASTGVLCRYVYDGTGTAFQRRVVRNVGEPFYGSYYNGACFDHRGVDTIYVAYNAGSKLGAHFLDRMVTTDGGLTWAATTLVQSAARIGRPRVGLDGWLYYTEFTDYNHWNDFDATIKRVAIP